MVRSQDLASSCHRGFVALPTSRMSWSLVQQLGMSKVTENKPPIGFDFRFRDGPIDLDVSRLWFMPLKSADDPEALAIQIGFPDADFVLRHQSVDAAYTILETAIGERSCTEDIAQVVVDDLPDSPAESGYLELPRLPDFIAFFKRRHLSE